MKRAATHIGDVTRNIIGRLAKARGDKEKKILEAWKRPRERDIADTRNRSH